jgi:hypothetical protein
MTLRLLLRCAALLALLAFLLPLAAVADPCVDCLGESSPDCCPPSCCSCCLHGPSPVLTAAALRAPLPAVTARTPGAPADEDPSPHSRDIFHVPKPVLL